MRGLQVEELSTRIRHGGHLAGRFFGFLTARPLSPDDQEFVHSVLSSDCARLFWEQHPADQRHAVDVASRVKAILPGDELAVEAALLHDIGKRTGRLGAVSRSIATVFDAVGLPLTVRMRSYRAHGAIGAAELERAECGALVVEFARLHPGPPPEGVDPGRWQVLLDADG